METLKVLNMNLKSHLPQGAVDFIQTHEPQVLTLQEVTGVEITALEQLGYGLIGFGGAWRENAEHPNTIPKEEIATRGDVTIGTALMALGAIAFKDAFVQYYSEKGQDGNVPFYPQKPSDRVETAEERSLRLELFATRALIGATFEAPGFDSPLTIATTHGTWTPDGMPTEAQTIEMLKMLDVALAHNTDFIIGDLNVKGNVLNTELPPNSLLQIYDIDYAEQLPADTNMTLSQTGRKKPLPPGIVVDHALQSRSREDFNTTVTLHEVGSDHLALLTKITPKS